MRMKKLLSLFLALVMVLSLVPTTVFATEGDKVYLSVSYDGKYVNDKDGDYIAYVPIALDDVAAVDLNEYNLGEYLYDENDDGTYETTVLQMVIYAHENIYGGSWSDVNFTGAPGSSYFAGGIFGFDENLNYYLNGEYPMDEKLTEANGYGTGATSDRIVLEAGDYLDIGSFSDWSFYSDSNYGFHFFADDTDTFTHSYAAETGTALSVKLVRSFSAMGSSATVFDEAGYEISYGTALYDEYNTVTTDDSGLAEITFPTAGTWYLWADGGYGSEYPDAIVSTPAYATVTVTGEDVELPDEEETPEETTDGKTALKITAEDGIKLQIVIAKCCSCYSMVYTKPMPTSVDTELEWTCRKHGTTLNAPNYNISATVTFTSDKPVGKITINGETYSVDCTDDVYQTINITETSYIKEANSTSLQIYIETTTEPDDLVIHMETARVAQDVSTVLNATMAQLAETVTAPVFGTTAGEWTVLSLARGGYFAKDNDYFTDYYARIVETVNTTAASVNLDGALHKSKSTENSRLIAALSSIGKDATAVGDWNLVEAYSANGLDWIKKQGLNGTIWALIALDSHNYATTDTTLRQQCVDSIVSLQHDDGGWSLMANKTYASDPDITGMALTALYPYRNQTAVAEACAKAIACLSEMQNDNGTFTSGGAQCAESCAWVIVATTTWGINPDTDDRFIKNDKSVVDGLLSHYLSDSATFQHIVGAGANAMATDQACYALVAYDRFINKEAALFDYSDVSFDVPGMVEGKPKITLGLPKEVTNDVGADFNAIISIDQWDNEGAWKLVDFIMTVPEGLKVTDVSAGSRLSGGEVSYHVDESGKLRVVYFDASAGADLTVSGTAFPAEVFTVTYEVTDKLAEDAEQLPIYVTGMSIKLSSEEMIVVDVSAANGMLDVVEGVSYSAVCLYEGDDVDLIPSTKKAVAVAVAGLDEGAYPKLMFKYNTFETELLYSAEITAKSGVQTYVALVDQSIPMVEFTKDDNFTLDEEKTDNAAAITFGDSNTDGVINAQDALNAVDAWLRKGTAPEGKAILVLNVTGDSRINTFDALGIVEKFVDGSDYAVVTKAATITTEND